MSHDETPHNFAFPWVCTLKDKKKHIFHRVKTCSFKLQFYEWKCCYLSILYSYKINIKLFSSLDSLQPHANSEASVMMEKVEFSVSLPLWCAHSYTHLLHHNRDHKIHNTVPSLIKSPSDEATDLLYEYFSKYAHSHLTTWSMSSLHVISKVHQVLPTCSNFLRWAAFCIFLFNKDHTLANMLSQLSDQINVSLTFQNLSFNLL